MSRALSPFSGWRGWMVLFLSAPFLVGCGPGTGEVTGKVTLKDKPVTSGAVTFHGEGGRTDSATIDPQGNYKIAQAPVGEVRVTVVATQPVTGLGGGTAGPGGAKPPAHPGRGKGGAPTTGKYVPIPKKYSDPKQSGLTFTVTSGQQTIDLKLE